MTKASDNQFPSILAVNTSNASISNASPWNAQRLFFDADGSLKRKDSSGNVQAVEGGGTITFGGVSSTDTVTVASNFAVSDQGGGTARLDVFFPGGGSGLSTGTSFPGGPSTGDRFRRSDIDYLVFFYDGTRWVSEQLFTADFQTNGQTTNGDFNRQQRIASWPTYDMYIVRANGGGRVSTTNNGSHYWNVRLYKYDGSYTALTGGWATSGDTVDVWTKHDQTSIGTVVSGASKLTTSADVSGSPGALHAFLTVFYRIIAT